MNQVRNRFTIVDIESTFCPDPKLPAIRNAGPLTPGPCNLGAATNRVLGRPLQKQIEQGELESHCVGPGRTVIYRLYRNERKEIAFSWPGRDMPQLFTTDVPGTEGQIEGDNHHTKLSGRSLVYGTTGIYNDSRPAANEDIAFEVSWRMQPRRVKSDCSGQS